MDVPDLGISPGELHERIGTQHAPLLFDVRRTKAFDEDAVRIVGAARRLPDDVGAWGAKLPAGRPVVVYCVHGHEVSQGTATALRSQGVEARYLEGGIAAWRDGKWPVRRKGKPSEAIWVTREHPKIDRIACPWLVSRFIDPDAEFVYVPADQVAAEAKRMGGTPYDIDGAEFGHVGERCSFDAIIRIYGIEDPALERLATIVRGADTSAPQLASQCEGLLAISRGLSGNSRTITRCSATAW